MYGTLSSSILMIPNPQSMISTLEYTVVHTTVLQRGNHGVVSGQQSFLSQGWAKLYPSVT